jgi:gas vesicle protein
MQENGGFALTEQRASEIIEHIEDSPSTLLVVGAAFGVVIGVAATLLFIRRPSPSLALPAVKEAAGGIAHSSASNQIVEVIKREGREVLDMVVQELTEVARELWEEQKKELRHTVRTTARTNAERVVGSQGERKSV